jgi:5-methylcytosine-specific restriction endonuclease McrA
MHFSTSTKRRARFRQYARCGLCGRNLDDMMDYAHHIHPDSLGGRDHPDNCVILCEECHYIVHHHGKFKSGFVAPKSYFRFFKGRAK